MLINLFKQTPIFAGLDEKALENLSGRVSVREFTFGETVISEGTMGETLYIVKKGEVEVIKNFGEIDEVVLARLGRLDFFGEMCIIESVARSATVRATDESTVLYALSAKDLRRLFNLFPKQFGILLLNISRNICRRLRKVDELYAAKSN